MALCAKCGVKETGTITQGARAGQPYKYCYDCSAAVKAERNNQNRPATQAHSAPESESVRIKTMCLAYAKDIMVHDTCPGEKINGVALLTKANIMVDWVLTGKMPVAQKSTPDTKSTTPKPGNPTKPDPAVANVKEAFPGANEVDQPLEDEEIPF